MKSNLMKLSGLLFIVLFLLNACSDSTEEADPCANGPQLSVDNITTSIEGQSNGEITVSASKGSIPYMYSINGINFQSSGTFSNLAGNDYTVTVKDANNCTDDIMATVGEVTEVSYANQVRPIIDTNCQISNCHGSQSGIPTFATYNDVLSNAAGIQARTTGKTMPPTGPLPDDEIQLIADWIDQGAPNN